MGPSAPGVRRAEPLERIFRKTACGQKMPQRTVLDRVRQRTSLCGSGSASSVDLPGSHRSVAKCVRRIDDASSSSNTRKNLPRGACVFAEARSGAYREIIDVGAYRMQVETSYSHRILPALQRAISPARMTRYYTLANGDDVLAMRLYHWNSALSEALHGPLLSLEITLRMRDYASCSAMRGTTIRPSDSANRTSSKYITPGLICAMRAKKRRRPM